MFFDNTTNIAKMKFIFRSMTYRVLGMLIYFSSSIFLFCIRVKIWICVCAASLCHATAEERIQFRESIKRPLELLNGTQDQSLSRNKLKKLRRNSKKNFDPKPDKFDKCACGNPKVSTWFMYNCKISHLFFCMKFNFRIVIGFCVYFFAFWIKSEFLYCFI